MPFNGEVRESQGHRYIWHEGECVWENTGRVSEPPPPAEVQSDAVYVSTAASRHFHLPTLSPARPSRRRQPNYIYRTVVDNKIKYKGNVYTARGLKGKLDGKRFCFKYYHAEELMALLSTAVVQEGQLRRLPSSIMDKFHEENMSLIYDRYGDRRYEQWYPMKKGEKASSSEVYVDPAEPSILIDDTSTVADTPEAYHYHRDSNGHITVDLDNELFRQRTPAEEARERDEAAFRYTNLAVGHLSSDPVAILQDYTALFDDERDGLRRYGIDTDHIVGSTRHHWIMDDGSIVYKSTGQITVNTPTAVPESHSTT